MLAGDSMSIDIGKKKPKRTIIDANWPCFVVAFTMTFLKLSLARTGTEDFKVPGLNNFSVIFLIEIASTPLTIINPRIWFSMFMCSLGYLCIQSGYPVIGFLFICSMFMVVYGLEYNDFQRKKAKRKNADVYKVLPFVDEKKIDIV